MSPPISRLNALNWAFYHSVYYDGFVASHSGGLRAKIYTTYGFNVDFAWEVHGLDVDCAWEVHSPCATAILISEVPL